jgi:Tol biopolymer transport system component/DNA-binding winged helix-turn-helix (wHTH) protein
METTKAFRIGTSLIQPSDFSIHFEHGGVKTLQPKYMEVLVYLAAHYPRVIPRQELIEKLWNNNDFVGEKALTNTIWHLRQNLVGTHSHNNNVSDNNANAIEIIKTIRKAGYQLLLQPQWQAPIQYPNINAQEGRSQTHKIMAALKKERKQKWATIVVVSLVLVSVLFLFGLSTNSLNRLVMHQIEQVTRDPGSEIFPSASPNGQYVAFAWETPDGQSNMYMLDRTQTQLAPRQLTFDDAEQSISVWSNDGQFLYFSRRNRAESICDIVEIRVATNQERKIAHCPSVGGFNYLDISPDDATLAFRGYDASTRNTGIYFIKLKIENAKPIRFSCNIDCGYKDRDMAFSPDGKYLAISRRNYWYSEDILIIDIATKKEQTLVASEEDIVGLSWHPDGKALVYATQRADIRRGYVINVRTEQIQSLNIEGFSYPSFAKQSGELFYQYQNERYFIAKLQMGSEVKSSPFPLVESGFSHLYPDYSAQADAIVYVSNESGFYELWMAESDGMNRQQLTFLEQSVNFPRWSRKGDKVAFLAPVENTKSDKIHIIDVESKKVTTVNTPFQLHGRPTWHYDDNAVISAVHAEEFRDLVEISLTDGSTTRLTFDSGRYGIMTSPTTLLYTRNRPGLWQKEIGGEAFLRLSHDIFDARYSWVYTNNAVYFNQNTSDHQLYMRYDFLQHSLIETLRLPPKQFTSYQEISVNINKDELLFTSAKSAQSDIKKLNHPLLQ